MLYTFMVVTKKYCIVDYMVTIHYRSISSLAAYIPLALLM